MQNINECLFGDCRDTMRSLIAAGQRVQMCVTSPPYFGLRSYDENAVLIDPSLDPETLTWLLAELQKRGVHAE